MNIEPRVEQRETRQNERRTAYETLNIVDQREQLVPREPAGVVLVVPQAECKGECYPLEQRPATLTDRSFAVEWLIVKNRESRAFTILDICLDSPCVVPKGYLFKSGPLEDAEKQVVGWQWVFNQGTSLIKPQNLTGEWGYLIHVRWEKPCPRSPRFSNRSHDFVIDPSLILPPKDS